MTITVTCSACTKPFTFDTADTRHDLRLRLSRRATSSTIYYPTCPHCKKPQVVTRENDQ